MKPLRLFTIIFLILICSGILRSIAQQKTSLIQTELRHEDLLQIFPEAHSFQNISDSQVYEALNVRKDTIGYIVPTRNLATGISGYGGPIHLLIGVTPLGDIKKTVVTAHEETPGFTDKITALLDQFNGKNVRTAFAAGKNIDGITGATITSNAIISSVNAAAEHISPRLSINHRDAVSLKGSLLHKTIPAVIISIILFSLAIAAYIQKGETLRWAALLSGFLFLGMLTQNMLSTSHIAGIALQQIPSWNVSPLWILLITGAIISCVLFGRVYCVGVCPFGFVEEFLYMVNTKLFRLNMSAGKQTDYLCRWIKYIILIVLLSLCLFYQKSGIGAAEAYITLFTASHSLWAEILVLIVLIGSFFFMRFWCRYLCPFGAFLAMIAQFQFIRRVPFTHVCANSAECFYCDHCSYKDIYRNTPKQTLFFISVLIMSLLMLGLSIHKTIKDTIYPVAPLQKNLAMPENQEYSDTSAVRKRLRDAGLTPYPAKYWKTINE